MLILIFGPSLGAKLVVGLGREFVDGDESFTRLDHNDFNGFYDWLRNDTKKIIGLTFYPFDPEVGLVLDAFSYVTAHVAPGGDYALTIYFGEERNDLANLAIVQEFGENYLYRSQNGTMSVSFARPPDQYEISGIGNS